MSFYRFDAGGRGQQPPPPQPEAASPWGNLPPPPHHQHPHQHQHHDGGRGDMDVIHFKDLEGLTDDSAIPAYHAPAAYPGAPTGGNSDLLSVFERQNAPVSNAAMQHPAGGPVRDIHGMPVQGGWGAPAQYQQGQANDQLAQQLDAMRFAGGNTSAGGAGKDSAANSALSMAFNCLEAARRASHSGPSGNASSDALYSGQPAQQQQQQQGLSLAELEARLMNSQPPSQHPSGAPSNNNSSSNLPLPSTGNPADMPPHVMGPMGMYPPPPGHPAYMGMFPPGMGPPPGMPPGYPPMFGMPPPPGMMPPGYPPAGMQPPPPPAGEAGEDADKNNGDAAAAVPSPHMAHPGMMPPPFGMLPPGMPPMFGMPPPPPGMMPPGMPPMSLEDVERMMLGQHMHAQAREQQTRALRRARRETRMRETQRFTGIMSQYEKDMIARIQISQLVSADPMQEDYYFQVFKATHEDEEAAAAAAASGEPQQEQQQEPATPATPAADAESGKAEGAAPAAASENAAASTTAGGSSSSGNDKNGGGNDRRRQPGLLQRAARNGSLQDQINRIVQNAKKRPKTTQFSLEGALGKISLKTTKNPRQIVSINTSAPTSATGSGPASGTPSSSLGGLNGKLARKLVFKVTEDLYALVLEVEHLQRTAPTADSKRTVVVTEDGDERPLSLDEETEVWERELGTAMDTLWARMHTSGEGEVHPLVQTLACAKGKKLFPRMVRALAPQHVTLLVLALFAHAQQLDVVRQASIPALFAAPQLFPGLASSRPSVDALLQFVDDVETFMHHVFPPVVAFVTEASWDVVSSCLEVLLDRNDVVRLGSAKAGLALLTMLVSRAEILSQAGAADGWPQLYQRVFGELHGHYLAFFPVTSMSNLPASLPLARLPSLLVPPLPPPESGIAVPSAAELLEFYLTDDAHVWQFIASLAVAASADQQHMLVAEVRERILGNVVAGQLDVAYDGAAAPEGVAADKAERSIFNVNLFLHALGLDASQIQTAGQ
ncbi:DNA topoisomerase 2-associated protein pat1 [Blastocladiella emersonii ATCC 22665]|nr:DNA topoisomerase 2-associated protein pat1 [Blastocladiella emersonii ATCC 22665]